MSSNPRPLALYNLFLQEAKMAITDCIAQAAERYHMFAAPEVGCFGGHSRIM